jgi:O-antigen/teichoic acid export membrane protein
VIRQAALILSGNAGAALLLLARNIVVARLIPLSDYGIASTLAIALAVVEMASTLGLQQQIVQSKQGEDADFQAALQGFQVLRGVIAALVLLAMAGPIAAFMAIPETTWAFRLLAAVPLLNALQHFDIHRLNRQLRYGPLILTGTVPALASVVALAPLSWVFGDWQVMLWSILLQAVLATGMSHLVAERPYRLRLDRAEMGRSLGFGWPLLVNSMLLFFIFQGEKLIVGRELGMEVLALYAMGVTLTLTPTLVLAKSAQNFFLPRLSALSADNHGFPQLAQTQLQATILAGGGIVLAAVMLGPGFIRLVLGARYEGLVPLIVPLAVLFGLRVFKGGPAVVALARGQAGNALWGNLPRVIALVPGWIWVAQGASVTALIVLGCIMELVGYAVTLGLLQARSGQMPVPLAPVLPVLGLVLGACLLALLPALSAQASMWPRWSVAVGVGLLYGLAVAMAASRLRFLARGKTP